MMNRIISFIAIIYVTLIVTSCTKDSIVPSSSTEDYQQTTFFASKQESNATRTVVASDGVSLNWTTDDAIGIYDNRSSSAHGFSIISGAGSTEATITGSVAEGSSKYIAVSPYSATKNITVSMDDKTVSGITIPFRQTATLNSYDPKAGIMLAYTEGQVEDEKTLSFRNVCAYIMLTTDKEYQKVQIVGDAQLAGKYDVTLDGDNNISTVSNTTAITSPSDIKNVVELTANKGNIQEGTYYIAVAPTQMYKFRVVCYTDTLNSTGVAKTFTSKNTTGTKITSNISLYLGTVSSEWDETVDNTRGATDGHSWVQLWANGPKFAEFNIGAKDGIDSGGRYCWGKSVDKDATSLYCLSTSDIQGSSDDTATNLWGNNWKMPSYTDYKNLIDYCIRSKIWPQNMFGRLFTGQGDYVNNCLFFPASGYFKEGKITALGSYGNYWTSTPSDGSIAHNMYFDSVGLYLSAKSLGYSVRAILK